MKEQDIKTLVLEELPMLIAKDPYVRESVWHIMTPYFAPLQETDNRFDRMMAELQRMREDFERRWEEQRQESERRWEEQRRKDEEQREEFERRWNEQQELNHQMQANIAKVNKRIDATIGALGARWGINSETSFRNALRGILEEVAHVQVVHVNDFDDEGTVFGRPDQVELDIVIHNGTVLICEIKSSMSKAEVYAFERKVRFYERRYQRQVAQMIIISPMIDLRALPVIQELGIRAYSHAEDVVVDDVGAGE